MYYGIQGLGESYDVRLPVVGKTTLEIPVSEIVNDAMESATHWLPNYLPQYYESALPYINAQKAAVMRDIEQWAPDLLDQLLETEVLPEANELLDVLVAHAENLRDTAVLALLAMTGTVVIAIGTSAWWINYREKMRDRGK
jgi:hypothetical protein